MQTSVLSEMIYLCTTFVVDLIYRDLRAFEGTSLDHKFLFDIQGGFFNWS